MPNSINDAELHEIVQRVVHQVMGDLARETVVSSAPSSARTNASERKVIAIGADHGGFDLKEALKPELKTLGFEISDVGTNSKDAVDYPDFANAMARAIEQGDANRGVLICGSGIGISMAANRHRSLRAAPCHDSLSARLARAHNDANVLGLGARFIGIEVARDCLRTFLTTEFEGGRHQRRVAKMS